jgi:phosphoribosylaminoimidazole-succinocarboxamide synthase
MLIDEVHTPDSSRFWEARSLVDRYMAGLEPVSMDKEIIRRALAEAGYAGDGPVPPLSAEVLGETSRRYIETYEKVTGTTFVPATEPVADRLRADLGDIAGWGA